jgi:hypothetical protein
MESDWNHPSVMALQVIGPVSNSFENLNPKEILFFKKLILILGLKKFCAF